jgi:hypothetical protein
VNQVHQLPGPNPDPSPGAVTVDGTRTTILHLVVDDPGLARLLDTRPQEERPVLVARALEVGARSLLTAGIGIDVDAIDSRVRGITEEAERRVTQLIDQGRAAFAASFDPEQRSSLIARALADFAQWRDQVLSELDPDRAGTATASFLDRLGAIVGPDGALERRIKDVLDPDADGSALARLSATMETRLGEMRDLLLADRARAEGRSDEARRGTAQGFAFEDRVEEWLRIEAGAIGGCIVERTGDRPGEVHNAKVGDFVITLADGVRIVVEAKNQATVGLAGTGGVLDELDRAMDNRGAVAAICVSARPAFPAEVGRFGVYGDRVLVVDEDEGTMLSVALRWAAAAARARLAGSVMARDPAELLERVERIRAMGTRISTLQRQLTGVRDSVAGVKDLLGTLRSDLLDLTDDLQHRLTTTERQDREIPARPHPRP